LKKSSSSNSSAGIVKPSVHLLRSSVQQRSNDLLALARAPGVRTLNVGVSTYQQNVGVSTIEQMSTRRQLDLLALSNVPRETKKFLFV
jgi:hypothetical protein